MDTHDQADVPVPQEIDLRLEEVSEAIGRAASDLLATQLVLDRERAGFAANKVEPSRRLLIAARRVVDEMRETDEALTDLLKELESLESGTS